MAGYLQKAGPPLAIHARYAEFSYQYREPSQRISLFQKYQYEHINHGHDPIGTARYFLFLLRSSLCNGTAENGLDRAIEKNVTNGNDAHKNTEEGAGKMQISIIWLCQ